ncbi:hypothetical protein MLD38_010156 [Melastoma candidum]|uniref:Uncharacterized protein n=1 Tax=Melastoma candidum TaxID=119954 RepID=A0ACB9R224_9MYRT|nr:hypothetical protein MLD38_010156 [Melastoma candidum]
MENSTEPSSSLSFNSSSQWSHGSAAVHNPACVSLGSDCLEMISLSKLSSSLEQLTLEQKDFDYSDATIVVEGRSVGVHRCILGTRSEFFSDLFKLRKGSPEHDSRKPKYRIEDLLPHGRIGYEALTIFLGYVYTGRLKAFPVEVSTCVDEDCCHDACRPAIDFTVELMYASHTFCIPELVSLVQRQLMNFVSRARMEDLIPVLNVAYDCQLNQLLGQCVDRVSQSDLDPISLEKGLPQHIADEIRLLCKNGEAEAGNADPLLNKKIKSIHKALDSDDVELVTMLLGESGAVTLDQAYALHYAAAYCDPKVVSELLGLGLADVNLRDYRGHTVLHVAATRKEPKIIISLLSKGASAMELTPDGHSAVSICRRLTRRKDYNVNAEQGQEVNKDKLCIEVLEREMRRNLFAIDDSAAAPITFDDLHMKLLHLENRVALAKLLFPTEAKLAMDMAHTEKTSEFAGLSKRIRSSGNLSEVDLNETPVMQNKRLRSRMEALERTVEMGRWYFPDCSKVLDKFMLDDLPDLCFLDKGTMDEQRIKTSRYMELKEDVQKAFSKDKEKLNGSSSSLIRQNGHSRSMKS